MLQLCKLYLEASYRVSSLSSTLMPCLVRAAAMAPVERLGHAREDHISRGRGLVQMAPQGQNKGFEIGGERLRYRDVFRFQYPGFEKARMLLRSRNSYLGTLHHCDLRLKTVQ